MAATHDIVLQTSAANIMDLTDPTINKSAVGSTTTPRQGGFTIRNRINADQVGVKNVTMPASALYSTTKVAVNQLYVLDVPKRTTVKSINLYSVVGESRPEHTYAHKTADASAAANDVIAHTLTFSSKAYKKEDQSAFAAIVAGNLGEFDIAAMTSSTSVIGTSTLNGGVPAATSASSTATPTNCAAYARMAGVSGAAAETTYETQAYFPFGGKVVMHLAGSSAWEATSNIGDDYNGYITGVWELQADCNYVPE